MILKVLLCLFLYIMAGSITAAVVQFHEDHCDIWSTWNIDVEDPEEMFFCVLLFPLLWIMGLGYVLFALFPKILVKGIFTAGVAIKYVFIALIKGDEVDGQDKQT